MFVKVLKNNTYFKRFQVRFRRRRESKTDYYQRKRLITQRKNKYNTPKYRFVVRRTNRKIVCQVVASTIKGDLIKAQALSTELKKFNLTAGLTNFPTAYATGLLCARRLLKNLDKENKGLDEWKSIADRFNLVQETTGDFIDIEKEAEKKDIGRPFVCFLDIGLCRSTVGARVFAALKGAVDGGLHIPHKDKVFPKFKEEEKKKGGDDKKKSGGEKKATKAKSKTPFRDRLFGVHIQNYMNDLSKDNKAYTRQFSKWDKCLKDAKVKTVEELYKKIFAEVRKNPDRPEGKKRVDKKKQQKKFARDPKNPNIVVNGTKTWLRHTKLNRQQRKDRVAEKIAKFIEERKKALNQKKAK